MSTDILVGMNLIQGTNLSVIVTSREAKLVYRQVVNYVSTNNPIFEKLDCVLTNTENIKQRHILLIKCEHLFTRGYSKFRANSGELEIRLKNPDNYVYPVEQEKNGDLCISILHPPVDDPQSGELPCERWNPTQSVRTVLLSVISLLNEPNTFSPANVDASVMYRRWRDSKGKDKEYENIIRKQAQVARMEAEKEGIVVPLTLEDYCIKTQVKSTTQEPQLDMTDFYDDDYDDLDSDSDEEIEGGEGDGDDSGNGES